MKFTLVYEAALAAEKAQWRIGDALLKEAEEAHAGPRGLQAVSNELATQGIEYSVSVLSHYRRTAEAFPRNRRHDNVSWAAHYEASNPDTLDVIVKAAKKAGHALGSDYVRDMMQQLRAQAQEDHRREKAEALRAKEKAEAEEEKARQKEKAARGEKEREAARAERQAANERRREADEKVRQTKAPPKRKDVVKPDEDEVPLMVVKSGAMANAGQARKLAEQTLKTIGRNAEDLGKSASAIIEAAMKTSAAWREVADHVRNASPNKRGHLSVVNE